MAMKIDPNLCTSCGDCEPDCPTTSIKPKKGVYVINAETCTNCEGEYDSPKCVELCPIDDCIVAIAA
jgi:ferredoxin